MLVLFVTCLDVFVVVLGCCVACSLLCVLCFIFCESALTCLLRVLLYI